MAATGQAGQAGGDAGQQGQGEAQAQEAPDFGALVGRMDGFEQGQQDTRAMLEQIAQGMQALQPQQEGDGQQQEPEPVDLSFLEDATLAPEEIGQQFQQVLDQRLQQALSEHLGPLQEQQAEQRRQMEAAQLAGEFPELADPETAQQVVGLANEYAKHLGKPELAAEPAFWRIIYMAGRASDAAQQEEGSGDPGAAHLEGGGGANPGAGQQVDPGDLIVQAGQGGRAVLPF